MILSLHASIYYWLLLKLINLMSPLPLLNKLAPPLVEEGTCSEFHGQIQNCSATVK